MNDQNNAAQAANQDQVAALQDLRHGVEMNRAYLDDGDIKLAALDAAIDVLSKLRAPVADERAAFAAVASLAPPCASRRGNDFREGYLEAKVDALRVLRAQASAPDTAKEKADKILRERMAPVSEALGLDVMFASAGNGAIRITTFDTGTLAYSIGSDGIARLRVSFNCQDAPYSLTVDQVKIISRAASEIQAAPQPAGAYVAGEAQAEKFIQAAIDQAPEPLRRLGEYLSRLLDEDQWATAERMLLGACNAASQAIGVGAVPWIHVDGNYLFISRCNWIYPYQTEDEAGPRDEARFNAIGRRDGDIVLSFRGAYVDAQDVATMLAWRAAQGSATVAGEPFMYGIMGPDGKAHFEEFCVSGDRTELQAEVVDHLNRDNPEDGTYSVVALFRDAAPQANAGAFAKLQSAYVGACDRIGELLAEKQTSAEDVRNAALEEAAGWVDKRRQDFDREHGYMEAGTGAWSFGTGAHAEAKAEYSAELDEIAEGLRAFKQPQAVNDARPCSCPGAGDGSLRHPCAVHPKADKDGGQQRAEVTEAQCVAVYQALDEFGSGIDVYDFGLPGLDDHRRQKVVEIIRAALSVAQPEQGERDEG